MKFNEIKMDQKIEQALNQLGYEEMMPIQSKVIPIMREGKDCFVQSRTGSGKTIAYGIPILESLIENQKDAQALILVPTRELALQVAKEITLIGTYKKVKCMVLIGKQSLSMQMEDLKQRNHIIVGTPGRIWDHIEQGNFNTGSIQTLILDEADALLNPDFSETIDKIVDVLPSKKQVVLVSATKNENVQSFMKKVMKDPIFIHIDEKNQQIESYSILAKEEQKNEVLIDLLCLEIPSACIIFCSTQERVNQLTTFLKQEKISVDGIHAGLDQKDRIKILNQFKKGKLRIIVATDVLARGIDIEKVDLIINYDLPSTETISIHRRGRSGRKNEKGKVISFQEKIKKEDHLYELSQKRDQKALEILSESNRKITNKEKKVRNDILCLYINAGKSKKIRAGDIVGAIVSLDGMDLEDIGVIRVQDHQSYVDIHHDKGRFVLEHLKTIKKKRVKVEIAHS